MIYAEKKAASQITTPKLIPITGITFNISFMIPLSVLILFKLLDGPLSSALKTPKALMHSKMLNSIQPLIPIIKS